jgi:hypothetical protein
MLVGQRDLAGLVQGGQPRFVKPAERVDQCLGQREPGADPQPGRAGAVGEPRGGPQRVHPVPAQRFRGREHAVATALLDWAAGIRQRSGPQAPHDVRHLP